MYTFEQVSDILSSEFQKINWNKNPKGLYLPIEYVLSMGGKRLRPALSLMACNMYTDDIQRAMNLAIGLEIFHNFTLLHDDIMDKAEIRRGKPTVHKQWNDNTAILSGDAMQIIAYQYINSLPTSKNNQIIEVFSRTALEVCEGQQMDMDFEKRNDVSVSEYMEMIRLKTAVLLGCAVQCGAMVGGADDEDATLLYEFGVLLGLAFQLQDDLMDTYANENSFGKKIGGDILCNKKTFLLSNALNIANNVQKTQINNWLRNTTEEQADEKVKGVIALYDILGIREICEDTIVGYYQKAIAVLEKIKISADKKQELRNLAKKMKVRKN